MRTLLGTSILASILALVSFYAGQDPAVANAAPPDQDVAIGSGFRLLRLAIPAEGRVGDILRKNAQISSGFEVIDRRSIPAALVRSASFDKKAWSDIGAETVVLTDEVGGQFKFRLFDIASGDKPVLSRGYAANDPLKAANRFMNDVIEYYTKIPGVFGSRIAFVRTTRSPTVSKNVFTVEMNGESPVSVTSNRSLNILPSIGPGGQVLFTSYAKRNPDLWIGGAGEARQVSKQPGLNLGGVMSPDGGSIAVTLSKDGNSEIYTVDTNGNIKARLTNNKAIDGSPSWSPGGNQIAFVSNRAGGPQVFRMGADGSGAARVSKTGEYNQSPDWNQGEGARGNMIAYSGRDASNRYDVFAVDGRSGKVVRLTQNPGRNLDPTWSPDGRMIAFQSSQGGIFVANEQGNNQQQIARAGSTPDWGPRAD
ncbi:MAG: PD40 domain-containing protein [Nannocystis sp.]|nr:PD40 domain-containing protein [Nannocystis sp.]